MTYGIGQRSFLAVQELFLAITPFIHRPTVRKLCHLGGLLPSRIVIHRLVERGMCDPDDSTPRDTI
jgi:hypothetical protein